MNRTFWTRTLPMTLAISTSFVVASTLAFAQGQAKQATAYKEKVLFNFATTADGLGPRGGLVQDSAGNLYGTTFTGGIFSSSCIITNGECGVVFKLDPSGNETVLHDFLGGSDGGGPWGSLVLDSQGNIYGTTSTGGSSCQCGVVYELSPNGTETVLYTFNDSLDGFGPMAGLVRDQAGNLYGTTATGGVYQLGSIFKIDASGNYSVLHSFAAWDGLNLFYAPLTMDAAGNLYGVAAYGGSSGSGSVFKLNPTTGTLTVLYGFTLQQDGGFPSGSVALDSAGNIYGETYEGGNLGNLYGPGVVFKIEPTGRYSLLESFPGTGNGGSYDGGMIIDQSGNLYGTTSWDGTDHCGSVFEIPSSGHPTTLHNFTCGADGGGVWAPVMEDAAGNLYGTAETGGSTGGGVVFELSPN